MFKNLGPLVIVIILIAVGIGGIFYLSNQKNQGTNDLSLVPTIYPTKTPQSPTPTTVIMNQQPASSGANMEQMITMPNGLQIQDLVVGTGEGVKKGDTVTVNYLGALPSGKQFDSSYERKQPFTTEIGTGQVIEGWDEGIIGMKVGGKRKLIIPPALGYGSQDLGNIPPDSTLIFEIELIEVR